MMSDNPGASPDLHRALCPHSSPTLHRGFGLVRIADIAHGQLDFFLRFAPYPSPGYCGRFPKKSK